MELGARSRNDEEKEQRRLQILRAALEEFQLNGFTKTTMSAIAKKAGQSRSLVNFYFNDKSGLYNSLEAEALAVLADYFTNAIDHDANGRDQLLALIHAYLAFHADHPGYFYLLGEWQDEAGGQDLPLSRPSQDVMSYLVDALKKGIGDGSVAEPVGSVMETAILIWASAHGCIQISNRKRRVISHHWNVEPERLEETIPDFIIRSLET